MKKLFTLSGIVIACFGYTANAQLVTITEANQLPAVGDTVHYVNANTFGFDGTGVGPVTAKVWDESALLNAGTTYDFTWVDPATVSPNLGRDSFPNATLARGESGAAGYFYYNNTANNIDRVGWFGSTTNFGIYENGTVATEFSFPITAGQTITSSYNGRYAPFNLGEDSVKIVLGAVSINADMQGTLILPTGTFTQVLRLHVVETFHIVTYFLGVPALDNFVEDDYYYWFSEDHLQALMVSGSTSVDGSTQAAVLRYQPIVSSPNGIADNVIPGIGIYPNPSHGKFIIKNSNGDVTKYSLEVFNMLGGKMNTVTNINAQGNYELNLSSFEKGIYFLKINTGTSFHTEKVVIQ